MACAAASYHLAARAPKCPDRQGGAPARPRLGGKLPEHMAADAGRAAGRACCCDMIGRSARPNLRPKVCQELTLRQLVTPTLLRSRPNDVNGLPARRTNSQRQLVSRDCNNAFLLSIIPIREGTTFDMNGDAAIRLTHRVCPEVGYGPVSRCLIFLGSPLPKSITHVVGTVRPHDGDNASPTCVKKRDARRIRPIPLDLGAIAFLLLPGDKRPGANELIL